MSALSDSARLALRDAGDRATTLYAVDAAERFYDAALRLWPEEDPERPRLLLRRATPVGRLGGGDPERLADATEALLAVGDTVHAAEAEMLLAQSFWIQGRRDLFDQHSDHAAALIVDAPPSRSSVWILGRRASRALLAGDSASAIELALQGRALAEQLGFEGA